jgi:hypothetical protein
MAAYRLDLPAFRAAALRRLLLVVLPVTLLAVAAGVAIAAVKVGTGALVPTVPIVAVVIGMTLIGAYRRQIAHAESLEITVSDDRITRSDPPLTLHRDEIARIAAHHSGNVVVHANDGLRKLPIPAQIANREQLVRELAAWDVPIEERPDPRTAVLAFLATLAIAAALAVTMLSQRRLVVLIGGSLLIAALVVSAVLLARYRRDDPRARQRVWWLIPVIAVLLARMLSVV